MIAAGASIVEVQHVLGHANAAITLRTYAHLFPGDEERIRNMLDAALDLSENEDNLRTTGTTEGQYPLQRNEYQPSVSA